MDKLSKRAARSIAAIALGVSLALAFIIASYTNHLLDPAGGPIGADFSAFYESADLAKAGHAVDTYDDGKMIAAEQAAIPGTKTRLPWNYPPLFQLILLPFALLPYIAAWGLWCLLLYGLYAWQVRPLASPPALWLLLLFPGAVFNLYYGENGLLTTVLIGVGVAMLPARPILAGCLLALTAYKPHFAILIPFALAFGGEWKALTAAVGAGLAAVGTTVLAFGIAPWAAFVAKLGDAPALAQSSSSDWRKIPSVLSVARNAGLGPSDAALLHIMVAALAFLLVMAVWRLSSDPKQRRAVLAVGALIVTPYLRNYDLALLIFPIAELVSRTEYGPAPATIALASVAWILPALQLLTNVSIQLTPIVLLALLVALALPVVSPMLARTPLLMRRTPDKIPVATSAAPWPIGKE